MKTLLTLILPLALLPAASAEDYSAFFRFDEGRRIDYSAQSPTGEIQDDRMKKESLLHVMIPDGSDKATLSLTYGGGEAAGLDDNWQGLVVHQGKEMIAILCFHLAMGEKVACYIIYPSKGVGFTSTCSAFLGSELFEVASQHDASAPFASASLIRLIEYKK